MRIIKQKTVDNYCNKHDIGKIPHKVGTIVFHFCPKCEKINEKIKQRHLGRST